MVCILNAYVLLEENLKFSATANVALRTRSAKSYPISNEGRWGLSSYMNKCNYIN